MNKTISKFLLTGGKFMPERNIKQPGFTHSACGPFTKDRDRIQKLRERSNLRHLYRIEIDKLIFLIMRHTMLVKKSKKSYFR